MPSLTEIRAHVKTHFSLPQPFRVDRAPNTGCYQHPLVNQYLVHGDHDAGAGPIGWGGYFCPACGEIRFVIAPKGYPDVLRG